MLNTSFSVGSRSGEHYISTKYGNKGFSSQQRDVSLDLLLDDSFEERTAKRDVTYYASKVGALLGTVTFIGVIIAIPVLTVYGFREKNTRNDHVAFYSAGAFVLLTLPISIREIMLHLMNYYMPNIQKYVIRILWMVPIYAVQSWLSLRFHESSLYIETLRDFYESYVLASFLYYLVELLGGEDNIKALLQRKSGGSYGAHPPGLRCLLSEWEGDEFLLQCKYGVLQYVVIKIFLSFITMMMELGDVYEYGSMRFDRGYVYVSFVGNLSQMWALYVLVKLYFAIEADMKSPVNWRPVGKFMCVKGVVFFTWWQGAFIAFLQNAGVIKPIGNWAADDVATGIQDYLICVEMLFFAIAHSYTFSYTEYMTLVGGGDDALIANDSYGFVTQSYPQAGTFREAFWNSTVPTEFTSDIKHLARGPRNYEKSKKMGVQPPVVESV